ncbi:MAG: hypothetical protein HYY01_10985 [Chloroflexi bacterium]|nr:hypothetical protein [Chloroflexota bacterium]
MAKKLMAWFGLVALVVAGCGPAATPTSAPVNEATPAPGATPAPVATATAKPPGPAPSGPQDLVYAGASWGEENLDPTMSSLPWEFTGPLWDLPVELTANGELKPRFATSWEQSADGLSWTFKLRQGIKFHDGQEMTAEDVKFSLEAVARPGARASRTATFRTRIKSIDVVDRYTVRINTNQPWVTLVYDLSTQAGSEGIVLPKGYVERVGWTEFNSKPIGSGPGTFAQHRAGNFIEFSANKDYWLFTPEFDRFRFVLVPELSTRIAMLKMGQADITRITLGTVPEVEKAGFRTITDPQYLSLRLHLFGTYLPQAGPLADLRVRQALNLAIDRQEMVDTMFYGRGKPAAVFPAGEITLGYPADLKPYPHDTAKAKQLLSEAGHAKGLNITLYAVTAGSFTQHREVAEAVAGYWRQIGVETKIIPTDTAWMRPRRNKAPQAPEIIGTAETFGGTARAVGIDDLSIWWSQAGRISQLADNIDDIVKRGLEAPTVEEMAKATQEAYRIIYNDYRSVPLVNIYSEIWGLGKRIGNIQVIAQRGYLGSSVPSATLAR